MIEVDPNKIEKLRESLDLALKAHADESYQKDPDNNFAYGRATRLKALEARRLIESGQGQVRGLAMSWMSDIQPIVEILFGEELEGKPLGVFREYSPTVFEGVYGRTRIVSVDKMWGPTVSLDLAAEDSM